MRRAVGPLLTLPSLGLIGLALVATAQASDYKVKVAYTPRAAQAPVYVAQEKGFFKEEGVNVDLQVNNAASTVVLPMLARGDIDVVFGGPSAALFNAMGENVRMTMVADGGRADPKFNGYAYVLVARKDLYDSGKLKNISDLKGKTVSFGVRGGTLDYMMYKALQRAGVQPSEMTIRYFQSSPDMGVALRNKALDAAAMIVPTNVGLAKQGITVDWKDVRELAPDMQQSVVMLSEDFAKSHREDAVNFTRAYIKAVRWIKQQVAGNDSELVGIVSKYAGISADEVRMAGWTYYDANGQMNVPDILEQYNSYVARGIAQPNVNIAKFVEDSIREDALKGLK